MHWLIIVGVVVLLFGAKRLPDAARSVGRSARILKAEVREMSPDAATADADTTAPTTGIRPGRDEALSATTATATQAAPRRG